MKLVSYVHGGAIHYGAVKGTKVVDFTSRLGGQYPDIVTFIANDGLPIAKVMLEQEPGDFNYEDLELLSVVPFPEKILCVGLNYHDHVDEANRAIGNRKVPDRPMMFARWPESMTGHNVPILRPKVSHMLDWEAELLVVIGKPTGRYVKAEDALDYVFGYTCMNEACLRDYQRHSSQINPGKNFEQTGANGPWMVTADEIPDPMNLKIQMRLNGQVMQDANTSQMIFSVQKVIEYITEWMPLNPGDLIASGTMGGVGFARTPPIFMKPGDIAEVEIERIGVLRNTIEDEPADLGPYV
ncbi:MAG: FAA hydrolase family protein [Betaproteobacteria bacterium]|nr:FAA hydrolase family protein [Betaproteobacteria bacterium]NBY70780.1 FAA hydrolase family protein [Betaproteobacteria bacterium]NDD12390.1 FAA hydrolase family protein [Betaproteobacteria bacterium]